MKKIKLISIKLPNNPLGHPSAEGATYYCEAATPFATSSDNISRLNQAFFTDYTVEYRFEI